MSHPIVRAVSGLVYEGDIDGAERALAVLADQEGDRALAKVIEEMPPRDVVAILREHDASRPTVMAELISPQQFVAAVSLERDYRERRHESLRGMINAVVFADEDRTDEFIEALGALPAGGVPGAPIGVPCRSGAVRRWRGRTCPGGGSAAASINDCPGCVGKCRRSAPSGSGQKLTTKSNAASHSPSDVGRGAVS